MSEAPTIRQEIAKEESRLKRLRQQLQEAETACSHDWQIENKPIYFPAHTLPGDPPGTMGVDWRGPCHVPAETKPRWIRRCPKCERVEHTTHSKRISKTAVIEETGGRASVEVDVPDWQFAQEGDGNHLEPKDRRY